MLDYMNQTAKGFHGLGQPPSFLHGVCNKMMLDILRKAFLILYCSSWIEHHLLLVLLPSRKHSSCLRILCKHLLIHCFC
uniref:Uncharacterized protein n=1 Tax=Rhizophora mucronata TaxID=61149 RepID=A0A2P2PPG9_RHIMU